MSNKLKIILAIITSVLIISGSAIIFNSQRRNNSISKTELSSLASSSSTVSSSSSSQVSSVFTSIPVIKTECNLPQSPNLVKTDNGCFGVEFLYADSSIFKDSKLSANLNLNKLDDNQQNRILLTHIATDYFKANKTKLLSKNYKIVFVDSIKLNNTFRLDVTFEDQEYNLKNKLIGIQPACVKQYDINTLNNTYKFYQNNLNYPCL